MKNLVLHQYLAISDSIGNYISNSISNSISKDVSSYMRATYTRTMASVLAIAALVRSISSSWLKVCTDNLLSRKIAIKSGGIG